MALFRARQLRTRPDQRDSDSDLVSRAQGGEREAFEELVRRHADHLYSVVRYLCVSGEEAEEVAQESFLRAWRAIGSFRGNSGFFTWLYRIGINEAKRRRQREAPWAAEGLPEDIADPPDISEAPHERALRGELRAELERAVRGCH